MKDIFGNKAPVPIGEDRWWFNGRIIQKQRDRRYPTWISYEDRNGEGYFVHVHRDYRDAKEFAISNPCFRPSLQAQDYIDLEPK